MWFGWTLAVIAFVILNSLLVLLFSSSKVKPIIKIAVIPIAIWFSIALFYGAKGLRGHAREGYPPYGSIVAWGEVIEDRAGKPGAIYLFVFPPRNTVIGVYNHPLDPTTAFLYFEDGEGMLYKIPYSREKHNEIIENLDKVLDQGGKLMWGKPGKDSGGGGLFKDQNPGFSILNPRDMLKKPESEE